MGISACHTPEVRVRHGGVQLIAVCTISGDYS